MKSRVVVTIDGPAGSGKSTIARLLEEKDGFLHIDTGAIYRAVGYASKGSATKDSINKIHFDIKRENGIELFYNGADIETFIRSEECGMLASNVAKLDFVRDFVNSIARKIASHGKYVIDGRDCGSVIFPDADLKVFLVADLKERAKRRAIEDGRDIKSIEKEINLRDEQDKNRDIAPLVKPKDAVVLDTTNLSIEDVYKKIKTLIEGIDADKDS